MQKNLVFRLDVSLSISRAHLRGDPGGTPYNGLYGEAPPEGGTFFRFQVYERVGIFFINLDYHLLFVLLIGGGGNGESPWKYVRNTDIITSMLWS